MEIEHQEMRRCDLFRVKGRVDSSTAQEFQDALFSAIEKGRHNIVVNLSEMSYISSAGIRGLVAALKATRGGLREGNIHLTEVPEQIKEVFDLAGLTSLFTFYDTETKAVGDF